jgi:hypothetical protein
MNSLLSLAGLWRKRYTVLKVSSKLNRCKIINAWKNRFCCSRIIDFPEESGQGQECEMDTNLFVSVIRNDFRITVSNILNRDA